MFTISFDFFFCIFLNIFFSVFQSCTSFHIFFQLFFPRFSLILYFLGFVFNVVIFDRIRRRGLWSDLPWSQETVWNIVSVASDSQLFNLTNVCFELDCWTRWTRWTVFWNKYLWVCSGMFWGRHWGRGPWWRPNEWGNSAMWDWGMDVNERTGMRWNEEGLNITLPGGLAIIEMDSDLLETKGCKEPMENLETFSTQRSAAEGDGETPEPVLKAPRRRTG